LPDRLAVRPDDVGAVDLGRRDGPARGSDLGQRPDLIEQ
jgi:hypothetical protein